MSKTTVLILTNYEKWGGIRSRFNTIDQDAWSQYYPDDLKPVSKCDYINGETILRWVDLDNPDNTEGVFLIYDSMDINKLEQLKEFCQGNDIYVLIHRHGDIQQENFNGWNVKEFRDGSHSFQTSDNLISVFDILTDTEPNKMERIINKVFTPDLEIVLKFLHQCLFPTSKGSTTKRSELQSALRERLPDNSDAKKALRDYTTNTGEKFEELRDKLLEFALNNH